MLEIKNLSHSYKKGKKAIDDITISINDGDIFAFIGPNGAGKTTVIKSLTGLLDFTSGDIKINGFDIKKDELKAKKQFAYVPDNPDVYQNITGLNYLNFVADICDIDSKTREERIKKFADIYKLTDNLNNLVESYSHGMKQKLVLISAFLRSPKLLVLDEPFVGLDPVATFTTKEEFKNMCKEGSAVFFSTHVLEVAEKLCNKVAIIKGGKIIAKGTMEEVKGDKTLEETFLELETDNESV